MEALILKDTNVYEVKYNDFGISHVIAHSFEEASRFFHESEYGVTDRGPVDVKSIVKLNSLKEPLLPAKLDEKKVEKVAKEMLDKHKEVFENLAAYDRGEKEYPDAE